MFRVEFGMRGRSDGSGNRSWWKCRNAASSKVRQPKKLLCSDSHAHLDGGIDREEGRAVRLLRNIHGIIDPGGALCWTWALSVLVAAVGIQSKEISHSSLGRFQMGLKSKADSSGKISGNGLDWLQR